MATFNSVSRVGLCIEAFNSLLDRWDKCDEGQDPLNLEGWLATALEKFQAASGVASASQEDETRLVTEVARDIRELAEKIFVDSLFELPVQEPLLIDRGWVWKKALLEEYKTLFLSCQAVRSSNSAQSSIELAPHSPFDDQPIEEQEYPLARCTAHWLSTLPMLLRPPMPLHMQQPPLSFAIQQTFNQLQSPINLTNLSLEDKKKRLRSYQILAKYRSIVRRQQQNSPALILSSNNSLQLSNLLSNVANQNRAIQQQIEARIGDLKAHIHGSVASLSQHAQERLEDLEAFFIREYTALEKQTTELQRLVERLGEEEKALLLSLEEEDAILKRLTEEYDQLSRSSGEATEQLQAMQRKEAEIQRSLDSSRIKHLELKRIQQELEGRQQALNSQISALQTQVQSYSRENASLEASVHSTSQQLASEQNNYYQLQSQINALVEKSSKLAERCEDVKDDINTLAWKINKRLNRSWASKTWHSLFG